MIGVVGIQLIKMKIESSSNIIQTLILISFSSDIIFIPCEVSGVEEVLIFVSKLSKSGKNMHILMYFPSELEMFTLCDYTVLRSVLNIVILWQGLNSSFI